MLPRRYHPALRVLHWAIALLIIAALFLGTFVMAPMDNADPGKTFALLKRKALPTTDTELKLIATAATPLKASPISMRNSKMPCQLCIRVEIRVQSEASSSAVTITFLRPKASESGPLTRSPSASMAVAQESDRLLVAGEMAKSWESTGRIGCTQ